MSHEMILRNIILETDDLLPMNILKNIAVRRTLAMTEKSKNVAAFDINADASINEKMPASDFERNAIFTKRIFECVVNVLQFFSVEDLNFKTTLSKFDMNSMMTVTLRRQLQQALKIKMPSTLMWSHPTMSHLIKWFADEIPA